MRRGIDGKVAIVTGGARGIGRAVCARLHGEGARVAVVDSNGDAAAALAAELSTDCMGIAADVSSERHVQKAFVQTVERFGSVDFVFNNAGIAGSAMLLTDTRVKDFDRVFEVNQRGVFLVLKAALIQMSIQGTGGAIVNSSSAAGRRGLRLRGPYCATKHAVLGLTKVAAIEGAADNVRVNAICPGPINTTHIAPVVRQWGAGDEEAGMATMLAPIPMARIGQPDEVAALVCWLFSEESSYVTGGTFTVDGGRDAQ